MSSDHIKAQIMEHENRLLETVRNSDLEQLDTLLHDDLLFNAPDGKTYTKAMDLEAYRSGNMRVTAASSSEHIISVIDDTAIVSVLVELKGEFFSQPIDGKFRYIRVWKPYGTAWKVIAGSCIQA